MSRPATHFTTLHAKLCITMCAETPRSAPTDDLRRFLHGVVKLGRTGIPWRALLPFFGHWNRIFLSLPTLVPGRALGAYAGDCGQGLGESGTDVSGLPSR